MDQAETLTATPKPSITIIILTSLAVVGFIGASHLSAQLLFDTYYEPEQVYVLEEDEEELSLYEATADESIQYHLAGLACVAIAVSAVMFACVIIQRLREYIKE